MSSKIKDQLKDVKGTDHELTDFEFKYLRELNTILNFNIHRDQALSNFLTYVALTRLGYDKIKQDHALRFDIDLNKDDKILTVKEVKA